MKRRLALRADSGHVTFQDVWFVNPLVGVEPFMLLRSSPQTSASLDGDFVFDDDAPRSLSGGQDNDQEAPHWVWVCVRSTSDPPTQVWVRFEAESAPQGLWTRAAEVPKEGDDGVVIVEARRPRSTRPKEQRLHECKAADPDLLTVAEFAAHVGIAQSSVFELIKKGLPSFKSAHVGRRIRRAQALAWLAEDGARRSRIGKRVAKARQKQGSGKRDGR